MGFTPFAISSPSKIILHGEHSVVYGKTAVAIAVGLRLTLKVEPQPKGGVTFNLPNMSLIRNWSNSDILSLLENCPPTEWSDPQPASEAYVQCLRSFVSTEELDSQQELALVSFLYLYTTIVGHAEPMIITVESQVPFGAGMGSSAAYAVCISLAMLYASEHVARDAPLPCDLVSRWAFCSEGIMHGTPSGIDNSTCAMGGAVSFYKGTAIPLGSSKMLALRVLLVDSKVSRNTKKMVQLVREKKERHPKVIGLVLDAMDSIAREALEVLRDLKAGNEEGFNNLQELIDLNQSLLCTLGVSHPALDRIVSTASSFGLHAKLTGAGGGGLAFVLLPPTVDQETVERLKEQLERDGGFRTWETELGVEGVRVEK